MIKLEDYSYLRQENDEKHKEKDSLMVERWNSIYDTQIEVDEEKEEQATNESSQLTFVGFRSKCTFELTQDNS